MKKMKKEDKLKSKVATSAAKRMRNWILISNLWICQAPYNMNYQNLSAASYSTLEYGEECTDYRAYIIKSWPQGGLARAFQKEFID